jgi:uncharacterized protein (DUF4415 family)
MKKAYDFSRGRRGAVIPTAGKTRITIYLDDAIVRHFKTQSERTGRGYQTLLNEALAAYVEAVKSRSRQPRFGASFGRESRQRR